MDYVLYVPGMSFNGDTIARGLSLGGSESAGYYLARELASRGHGVTVFSHIPPSEAGRWEEVTYLPIGMPSEAAPFGERYEAYVSASPHDVLIGQRVPALFQRPTAAKVNLWWTHDLGLRRHQPALNRQQWNLSGVLCVSRFHREQLAQVYGLKPERIAVAPNGVDARLFGEALPPGDKRRGKVLLYSSRPERGLENLVGGRDSGDGPSTGSGQGAGGASIMERLAEADPEITLQVCGYDNTAPELAGYYALLMERCTRLPNVNWLGALSKPELARRMREAWLHIYPTQFEEVSCITAMETQCAGTPILTSPIAALPETLRDGGVVWIPMAGGAEGSAEVGEGALLGEGGPPVDREAYVRAVLGLRDDVERYERLHRNALDKAPVYRWSHAADAVEAVVEETLTRQCGNRGRMARHLMRHSDIGALEVLLEGDADNKAPPPENPTESPPDRPEGSPAGEPGDASGDKTNGGPDALLEDVRAELEQCYRFAREGGFARHYADYYAYERERGVVYGPERLDGNPRFEAVARHVTPLAPGSVVLDYGCAHGHYTINLARRHPALRFVGVDLVRSNIDAAVKWAAGEGLDNVRFLCGALPGMGAGDPHSTGGPVSAGGPASAGMESATMGDGDPLHGLPAPALVIAAEVLEHVPRPAALADALAGRLADGGQLLLTTPYGPWEAQGYVEHHPWRAHLHHLERADLVGLFGHHPGFALDTIPAGRTAREEPLGSYLVRYRKPAAPSGRVDHARKLRVQAPRETLSVCMIVTPEGDTLARCLKSVAPFADEVILGIDDGCANGGFANEGFAIEEGGSGGNGGSGERVACHARALAERFGARTFSLASPLRDGFAAARNATVERAAGDWILWIDDDEELLWPERLPKYLRDNGYDAYAVKQHHFAVEPGGVIKTDFPCRIFRNRRGFRFHGLVHEHPELGLNEGAGHVLLLPDVAICHNGYMTEEVRRARFLRNLPLMRRDREEHGGRLLGRFLWIRDLAHLNRFEFEQTRTISPAMRSQAEEAVALWRGLLADGQVRMAVDALPYYSEAANLLTGGGIDCELALGVHHRGLGDPGGKSGPLVQGQFMNAEDIEKLTQALVKEKTGAVTGKYV